MVDILEAGRMLGRKLCGKVTHVTGTSVRRNNAGSPELELYVDVDCGTLADLQTAITDILQETQGRGEFCGYELHVHIGGQPKFMSWQS